MVKAPANVLDDKMKDVFDTLLKPVRRKMAYSLFQKKYLPFLSLEPVPKETVEAALANMSRKTGARHTVRDLVGNLLNEWMEDIAEEGSSMGGVFCEVEVYDSEGNIVYVVPPLLDGDRQLIGSDAAATIPQLVEHASNQARILPEMGENYIRANIIPLIRKPSLNARYRDMWNVIYTHHNLPLYPTDGSKPNETNTKAIEETNSDVVKDFDDFGD